MSMENGRRGQMLYSETIFGDNNQNFQDKKVFLCPHKNTDGGLYVISKKAIITGVRLVNYSCKIK